MAETSDSAIESRPVTMTAPSRLGQAAALVGIVAGVVFIVALVFFSGVFVGAHGLGRYWTAREGQSRESVEPYCTMAPGDMMDPGDMAGPGGMMGPDGVSGRGRPPAGPLLPGMPNPHYP